MPAKDRILLTVPTLNVNLFLLVDKVKKIKKEKILLIR